MEIRAHLTDREFEEALVNPGKGLVAHLDRCDACRAEVGQLRRALDAARLDPLPAENFWLQQRATIRCQIAAVQQRQGRRVPRLAWAALAATVALGSVWISDNHKPVAIESPPKVDPDQELMMAVEHAMQSDVPEALEPASLLAEEIIQGRGNDSNSASHTKETR